MKYINMPNILITGKIANNHLAIYRTKQSNTIYTIIMLYIIRGNHALLYPITFFNKLAYQIVQKAQQGDLISITSAVSPIYTNYSLVATKWDFAEYVSKNSRKRTIKQNFPIIPDNYPSVAKKRVRKNRVNRHVTSNASKHLSQAEVNPKSVEIIPPHSNSVAQDDNSKVSNSTNATIHIKPHIISTKAKSSNKSKEKTSTSAPYDWMHEMNKDLGMTFDKMN